MITGLDVEPLSLKIHRNEVECCKERQLYALVFDDLKKNRIEWDAWGKFFWDRKNVGHPHSQLLVTANDRISTQGGTQG